MKCPWGFSPVALITSHGRRQALKILGGFALQLFEPGSETGDDGFAARSFATPPFDVYANVQRLQREHCLMFSCWVQITGSIFSVSFFPHPPTPPPPPPLLGGSIRRPAKERFLPLPQKKTDPVDVVWDGRNFHRGPSGG